MRILSAISLMLFPCALVATPNALAQDAAIQEAARNAKSVSALIAKLQAIESRENQNTPEMQGDTQVQSDLKQSFDAKRDKEEQRRKKAERLSGHLRPGGRATASNDTSLRAGAGLSGDSNREWSHAQVREAHKRRIEGEKLKQRLEKAVAKDRPRDAAKANSQALNYIKSITGFIESQENTGDSSETQ